MQRARAGSRAAAVRADALLVAIARFITWAFAATTLRPRRLDGPAARRQLHLPDVREAVRPRRAVHVLPGRRLLGRLDERAVADAARAVLDARRARSRARLGVVRAVRGALRARSASACYRFVRVVRGVAIAGRAAARA